MDTHWPTWVELVLDLTVHQVLSGHIAHIKTLILGEHVT
jgi:hypothetical protein